MESGALHLEQAVETQYTSLDLQHPAKLDLLFICRFRAKQSTDRTPSLQEGFNVHGYPVSRYLLGKEVVSL